MGNKVSRVIISTIVLIGCGRTERIIEPTSIKQAEIEPITIVPEAEEIAGFEARFFAYAEYSIKNTGTTQRWAYAYLTGLDDQITPIASKSLLVNPGATWTSTFSTKCVQLDLSTESVGGRPDIGFQFYDKQGNIMTTANRSAKIAECRAPSQCISDRSNPNWNCQECSDPDPIMGNKSVCLVPR